MWWKTNSAGSNFRFLANVMKDERGSGDIAPEKLFPLPVLEGNNLLK